MLNVFELAVALFLLWVFANVVRAVLFKATRGGGFWGLYNFMTRADQAKQREADIEAEVRRRLSDVSKTEGGQRKQ